MLAWFQSNLVPGTSLGWFYGLEEGKEARLLFEVVSSLA